MKSQKGFTLTELLISLMITCLIATGIYRVLVSQAYVFSVQESVADTQNASRAGMEIMFGDLRMAGYDKEGGGSNVVVGAPVSGTANTIRVEWELNNDTIKAVQYSLSGRKLIRNIYLNGLLAAGSSPEEVLDDVEDLTFSYSFSGSKIVKARISLTLSTKPIAVGTKTPEPLTRTLVSSLSFRNVK